MVNRFYRRAEQNHLWYIHKPVSPVWFMKMILVSVKIYLREVQLRCVPAANSIISSKVSLNGVIVSFCLVPF